MSVVNMEYPLTPLEIIKKQRSIKKRLLQKDNLLEKRIAVLGGSTTSEIKSILEVFLLHAGIRPAFYESGYGRYYEDAMFDNRQLEDFKPDIIYIHTSNINIQDYPCITDTRDQVQKKLDSEMHRFRSIWERIQERYGCCVIQNNFEMPLDRPMGNLDCSDYRGRVDFLARLNIAFAEWAQKNLDFHINDINYMSAMVGLRKWVDRKFWYLYKYALSYEAIPVLCQNVAKIIKAVYGMSMKCLVLDLDNTLWGGVAGEDVDQIKIGNDTALGQAYTGFQNYIKQLKDAGIILAVCSKNNMEAAIEALNRPDNVLKESDFSVIQANWDPKHENIKKIARSLNISTESMVFVDDSPAERELVRAQLPGVSVPEIGSDVVEYIDYIDKPGLFEPVKILEEDISRGRYYQISRQAENEKAQFASYDEFLESLEMKAEIKGFEPAMLERISQLTNKTNQFNLTTRRYNLSEMESLMRSESHITLYGRLIDRFGDNGIVSVMIGHVDGTLLEVELWLMSCRVFRRNMELAMFDELVARCKAKGIRRIDGRYYRTAKNGIVRELYRDLGFDCLSADPGGDSVWSLVIPEQYKPKNSTIRVAS